MSTHKITLSFLDRDSHEGNDVDKHSYSAEMIKKRLCARIDDLLDEGFVLVAASEEGGLFAYAGQWTRNWRKE